LVYTAFSGSHQDAISKCLRQQTRDSPWRVVYLPIDPRDIGRSYEAVVRVNSQSGKGGTAFVLERDYGIRLPKWMQPALAKKVQQLSEQTAAEVRSEQIYALWQESHVQPITGWQLTAYTIDNHHDMDLLSFTLDDGRMLKGEGIGTLSALIDALALPIEVVDYQEHALTQGASSQAVAYVQLCCGEQMTMAAAIADDVVCASLQAVLTAVAHCQAIGTSSYHS
jgi:2-isopropylmalate synthase